MSIVVTPSHCVTDIRGSSLEALPDEVPFLVIIVVVLVVAEDDGDGDGDGVSEGDNRDDDDDDGDGEAGNKCVFNRCCSPSK